MNVLRQSIVSLTVLSLVGVALSGCVTAKGQLYSVAKESFPTLSKEHSRIYFLRENKTLYSAAAARIHVNGLHEFDLANGGFVYIDVKEGAVPVMVDASGIKGYRKMDINAYAGQEYFLSLSPNGDRAAKVFMFGALADLMTNEAPYDMEIITNTEAHELLKQLKLSM